MTDYYVSNPDQSLVEKGKGGRLVESITVKQCGSCVSDLKGEEGATNRPDRSLPEIKMLRIVRRRNGGPVTRDFVDLWSRSTPGR